MPVLSIRSNFAPTRMIFLGGSYSSDSSIDTPDFLTLLRDTRLNYRLVLISYSSVLETFFGILTVESGLSSSM